MAERWPDSDAGVDSVSPPGVRATDDAAWGKDLDIGGALEGTATDQVRAMSVGELNMHCAREALQRPHRNYCCACTFRPITFLHFVPPASLHVSFSQT